MRFLARLTHTITTHIRMLWCFRGFWLWLIILWVLLYCLIGGTIICSELFSTIFGLLVGIWLTKIGNDSPVFVRSYGDSVYKVENALLLIFRNSCALHDRILVSLFGSSLDKALYVYPFSIRWIKFFACSLFNLAIEGADIVCLEKHRTRYLQLANSDLLYAFPDWETHQRFRLSATNIKRHEIHPLKVSEGEIKKYRLGQVLTSAQLWADSDVLAKTADWQDFAA